jgi:hypothetical protein
MRIQKIARQLPRLLQSARRTTASDTGSPPNECADVATKRGDDFAGTVQSGRPRPWTVPGAAHLCLRCGGWPRCQIMAPTNQPRCAVPYRQDAPTGRAGHVARSGSDSNLCSRSEQTCRPGLRRRRDVSGRDAGMMVDRTERPAGVCGTPARLPYPPGSQRNAAFVGA